MKPFLLAVSSVFPLASALAAEFSGSVVSILGSDTIEVLHNLQPERIRLMPREKASLRQVSEASYV
jgi:hypothetical protein